MEVGYADDFLSLQLRRISFIRTDLQDEEISNVILDVQNETYQTHPRPEIDNGTHIWKKIALL